MAPSSLKYNNILSIYKHTICIHVHVNNIHACTCTCQCSLMALSLKNKTMYMYILSHNHIHISAAPIESQTHPLSATRQAAAPYGHTVDATAIIWLSADMGPHTARYAVPTPGTGTAGTLSDARLLRAEYPGTKHSREGAALLGQALGVWMLNVYSHSSSGKTSK